jgi:hypothetical protein
MLVYLGFEVATEKKIARCQIWRMRRLPDVPTQGDNMSRKHFSENSERTTRCVGCCSILLKPHILCSMFIEKIIQFRPEKVLYHCTIPIGGHRYSSIVLLKKVRTPHTKLKHSTTHSNLGAVEWPLVNFPRVIVRPVPEADASLSANCHFE